MIYSPESKVNECLPGEYYNYGGGGGGDTTEIFKFIQFSTFLNPIITHTVQLFKVATG